MRGSMIIGQHQRLSLFLSIIFTVACFLTTTTLSNPNLNHDPTSNKQGVEGLTLKLIHRDLIYPPSKYEYDHPITALAAAGLGSNLSKAKNINQTSYHEKQRGKLFSTGNMFYVDFYIGTPGVRQFASLDTGSSFIWVQCAGFVHGLKTNNSIYNPQASRSYKRSSCHKPDDKQYCKKVIGSDCDAESRCEYNVKFVDGSRSKGHIGFETISFSEGSHNQTTVSNVLFGCGTDNYNTNPAEDGVFGIGGILELSIVKQTQRRRFSFCIGSISDIHNEYNHLALGNHARLEGVDVSYRPLGGRYVVTLDLIRIGATTIPLPRSSMLMIDSGATLSHFTSDVYNKIRAQVTKIIGQKMVRMNSTSTPNGLCYEPTHIWKGFPSVSIVSGGESLLVLDIEGMFWRIPGENTFCLAIEPSQRPLNVIGVVAMQNHNVGFDMWNKKAYFQRKISCNPYKANG